MSPKPQTLGSQQSIIVRIEDVDITNRLVHVFDKMNGRIQVSFRDIPGGGLLRIPIQDEKWIAERVGWIWRLKGRLTSLEEQARLNTNLQPGDTIISGPGTLYLDVNEVLLNDKPIGHTRRDVFTKTTSFNAVTLSTTPSNYDSIQPFVNGLLVDPTRWSITDKVITFATTLSWGTIVVYYEAVEASYVDSGSPIGTAVISATETYTP